MHFVQPEVVKSLKSGSRVAFKEIYDMLGPGVYSVSFNLTKDRSTAEEIVQEVFVKLWLCREELVEDHNIWVFLYIVAKRLSLNKIRAANRTRAAHENIIDFTARPRTPEEDIFYKELQQLVSHTIADLPSKQRAVIEMSRNEGLTYQEIAQRLGISSHTVRNHIAQALKHLRLKLKDFSTDVYFLTFVFYFFLNQLVR